jgi:hypothetical protein
MFNAGLGHNCDFKDAMGEYWGGLIFERKKVDNQYVELFCNKILTIFCLFLFQNLQPLFVKIRSKCSKKTESLLPVYGKLCFFHQIKQSHLGPRFTG